MKRIFLFPLLFASLYQYAVAYSITANGHKYYYDFYIDIGGSEDYKIYYHKVRDNTVDVSYVSWGVTTNAEIALDIVVPDSVEYGESKYSVTAIGDYAFSSIGNTAPAVTISITLPNSVTNIGVGAFQNCRYIRSLVIPNSVTKIGNLAFAGCSNLKSINIPNSVTYIGSRVFQGCECLTSVTINSKAALGDYAFPNTITIYYYATSISLNKTSFNFSCLNSTQTLSATISPANVATNIVKWASSDTNVVLRLLQIALTL